MVQTKISLEEAQVAFLNHCRNYGFKDKSALVRAALKQMEHELTQQDLAASAELYAELYEQDAGLRELTEVAIAEWPE